MLVDVLCNNINVMVLYRRLRRYKYPETVPFKQNLNKCTVEDLYHVILNYQMNSEKCHRNAYILGCTK